MYIQNSLDFKGATGRTYSFDVYTKSTQLPDNPGIYLLMYCHPKGHLAGLKITVLRIGIADNLNSVIANFRQDEKQMEHVWNYTGIRIVEEQEIRFECFSDLAENISVYI